MKLLQFVGRVAKTTDRESIGFVGVALSIDAQYLSDYLIPRKAIILRLEQNYAIESIEKLV